jgi:hypothetical protein
MKPIVKSWTEQELVRFRQKVLSGASVTRCSAAFDRPSNSVRNQARRMGIPLVGARLMKAAQKAKIASAESKLPPGSWRYDGTRV